MSAEFVEGTVKYPEDLPCPQVDTDLVPRERRYISDITDVRNMRMFQQEFQATRNKISFIFTEEEAREFREWYENDIIFGGAWFYADWPILHKDKQIPYRFVGQPKYEWLLGANPGAMGRSAAGYNPAVDAVTMYKVTATVELYERKVGKVTNVYTSKIYPICFSDDISDTTIIIEDGRARGDVIASDDISTTHIVIPTAAMTRYEYRTYRMIAEDITVTHITIPAATISVNGLRTTQCADDITSSLIAIDDGIIDVNGLISYDRCVDEITTYLISIEAGEIT